MPTIDRSSSFIQFVYPFLFDLSEFEERCKAVNCAQWPGRAEPLQKEPFTVWRTDRFPEEDVLPHVADYLNPKSSRLATAHLWELVPDSALISPQGFGATAQWEMLSRHSTVAFHIREIKLALFRVGVGFITVFARPQMDSLNDWLDFAHHFRFSDGQHNVRIRMRRRTGEGVAEPFFPEIAGGVQQHPEGEGVFSELLDALLHTAGADSETTPLPTPPTRWWRDMFVPRRMLPFLTLFIDGATEEEKPLLLYQARHFFHSRQEMHPAPEALSFACPDLLPYAQEQWFAFSLDGGAFVAFDAPPRPSFFREQLPGHLCEQYFLLFLVALHQRFALMALSEQVARNWLLDGSGNEADNSYLDEKNARREDIFRRIRDALLIFAARGYFTQIMQRENHHRCYRKWQETLQVEQLHQEVVGEVREMHDYLLMERTERLKELAEESARAEAEREHSAQQRAQQVEQLIGILGVFIGVPSLAIGFLGINLRDYTAGEEGLTLIEALTIVGDSFLLGIVLLLVLWLWRLRKETPVSDNEKVRYGGDQ